MAIERDPAIQFHPQGTLQAVTRWIARHEDGLAEWAKNIRRAYQPDRADVAEEHRASAIFLRDAHDGKPARIGFLDVGGATFEDVTRWTVWQDPRASAGRSDVETEQTQGNGGKAYMYRLFAGPSYLLGVRDGKRNCKGFEGAVDTLDRGTPGFIPDSPRGREVPIKTVEEELERAIEPYGLDPAQLPEEVRLAVAARGAFTLVEGIDPIDVYEGRIPAEDIVQKFLRHDQTVLVLQQIRVYAAHNAQWFNGGKPLAAEPIVPYPEVEGPFRFPIPEYLPDDDGIQQSTTANGTMPTGVVTIYTSKENMPGAWRRLRPRWKVTYRTSRQVIGSKAITEIMPPAPGYQHVHAVVELDALDSYATHGRVRPREGPLLEAVELFVAAKAREIAKQISDKNKLEFDEHALDEVQKENERLDKWKNRFLEAAGDVGGGGGDDTGGGKKKKKGHKINWGDIAEAIDIEKANQTMRIGRGVVTPLGVVLQPVVRDHYGKPVAGAPLEWISSDRKVVDFVAQDKAMAVKVGKATIRVRIASTGITSVPVAFEVWNVDHVFLTPRELEIPVGTRREVTAEVTNDNGERSADVLLTWRHEADDQMIVRIRPTGWITGNRVGRTVIMAGCGDSTQGGVWSHAGVEVRVVPNPNLPGPGSGFPRLLITDRDPDPETGQIRHGDRESPSLWQEVYDAQHNIWWLNLGAPDARHAFGRRDSDLPLWRQFHAMAIFQMVKQARMHIEYTQKGEHERPETWAEHKASAERFEIQVALAMWEKLSQYVLTGEGIE